MQNYSEIFNYPPPANLDAEESVLGACLFDEMAIACIADTLPESAFLVPAHQDIYRTLLWLHSQGKPTDLMSVTARLADTGRLESVGGQSKLAQLCDRTVSSFQIDRHARLLLDKMARRDAIACAYNCVCLAHTCSDPTPEMLEKIEEQVLGVTRSQARYESAQEYHRSQYQALIAKVRRLEMEICDPGERAFNLRTLAKQYNCTTKELESLYYKSLLASENEAFIDLDQAYQRFQEGKEDGWLLNGLIPHSTTILCHSLGGVGKTLFAYFLARILAAGESWGEFIPSAEARRVGIIQTDETFKDMMKKISHHGFDPKLPLSLKTRWTIDHLEPLRQEILAEALEFVVIDSLTSISRHSLYSENDTEYARPILQLRDIAQETGCTFLIVHHDNKQGDARGTGAIFNSVSEVWSLKKDPQTVSDATRIFTIEKSRSRRPAQFKTECDYEDYSWFPPEEVQGDSESQPLQKAIVNFLSKRPNIRFEAMEIEAHLGCSGGAARRALLRLSEDGIISRERVKKNRAYLYFLSSSGDPSLRGGSPPGSPSQSDAGSALAVLGDPGRRLDHQNADEQKTPKERITGSASYRTQAESLPGQDLGLVKLGDPLGDPRGEISDRQRTAHEPEVVPVTCPQQQLALPKFTIGDRVLYIADEFERYQGVRLEIVETLTKDGKTYYRGATQVGTRLPFVPEADLIEDRTDSSRAGSGESSPVLGGSPPEELANPKGSGDLSSTH